MSNVVVYQKEQSKGSTYMDFVGVLEVRFGQIAHFETLSLETHEVREIATLL